MSSSDHLAGEAALIIAGPTASGKSAMAMALARHFDGVVINADSMQVYKDLRIVTARPSEDEEKQVPHRLYGGMDAGESCSAGHWLELASAEIEATLADGKLPIVVGGTGMYLMALTGGLSPMPDIPDHIRAAARARHVELGAEAFHAEVAEMDAGSAAKLPPGDRQRLIRAWEVATATGRTLTDWQREPKQPPLPHVRFATIVLLPDRADLYAAIDGRFAAMVEQGALDEVKALLARGLDPALPAMKAVGVSELAGYLSGEITLEDAISKAQQASRNYAKRQLTWLRNQIQDAEVLPAQYSESLDAKIFSFVHDFLLTRQA